MENTFSTSFFFLYNFPPHRHRSLLLVATSSDTLCSDVHGEGHAAQVAVGGRIVNDALPIQFALYLDVSVIVHSCKTHSHHWWGVVDLRSKHDRCHFRLIAHYICVYMSQLLLRMTHTHMSELPIVWIVLQVKGAFRKKLNFSQSVWRSFLKKVMRRRLSFFNLQLFPWHHGDMFYWHVASRCNKGTRGCCWLLYLNFTGHIYWFALAR